jgi:hypothetical protein
MFRAILKNKPGINLILIVYKIICAYCAYVYT